MTPLKSDEEIHFNEWCLELIKEGYIIDVTYEPKALKLSDTAKRNYTKELKAKSVDTQEHLLHGHEYTYDFDIYWREKAIGVFICVGDIKKGKLLLASEVKNTGIYLTAIETKGSFDFKNMTRLVMLNIKWAYKDLGLYVNLVKVPDYFSKTFYPKSLVLTKTGKTRKLKFKPVMLNEFLNK